MNKQPQNDSEDEAFWETFIKDVRKLPESEETPSKPVKLKEIHPSVNLAAAYRGEELNELETGNTDGMDGSMAKRFKRCDFPVEATLDLHGYREEEAHTAVTEFIQKAYLSGKRVVIIITGKGSQHADDEDLYTPRGKLKQSVPLWLNNRELRPLILSYIHPTAKLGGSGALYIMLRRKR